MAERGFGRRLGSFLLALLNATLVLAALCLWLAWGALSAAERVAGQLGDAAQTVLPLRAEIAALTEEIAGARADLAARRAEGATDIAAIERRIAAVEAQLQDLTAAVAGLGADPDALIAQAVSSAFDGLGDAVAKALSGLRGTVATDGS